MLSKSLRDMLILFIDSEISTEDLERWVVPRLPELIRSPESPNSDVVAAIELGLVELSTGEVTEDQFRSIMQAVLQEHPSAWSVYVFDPIFNTESSSSNSTSRVRQASEGLEITMDLA
ncbi:MAG: hypothetical protein ACC700_18235 [Anaerolineales bacterium]